MSALYPELEPYAHEQVPVGDGHALYLEQCGNPSGFPVVCVHGGPGSATRPFHRRFFDPTFYRILLFDQRGCGRSTPVGCTQANDTGCLIADIEALRTRLGLDRVMLFGGSWGAALALAYAIRHPGRVSGMVLRGVFLASRTEIEWYLYGLRRFVPDAWDTLAQGESCDLLGRYHSLVSGGEPAEAHDAARRWLAFEDAVTGLGLPEPGAPATWDEGYVLARARIQLHFLVNDCFMAPGELLAEAHRVPHIPIIIVQGGLDMACPPWAARELARRLPSAELRIVPGGAHSADQAQMSRALRRATDDMRVRLD